MNTSTSTCSRLIRAALLCVLAWSAFGVAAQTTTTTVSEGWELRLAPGDPHAAAQPKAATWLPARVPGAVQTDLMAAGLLPDPWAGDNEPLVQWVGLADWQMRTTLRLTPAQAAHRHLDLIFEGLDTLATVRVNGVELLKADNMYRSWRVDAKRVLVAGDNRIEIDLASPIKALQPKILALPHVLPGSYDSAFGDEPKGKQTAGYLRKAGYQYGWDWAPRVVTIGVWKPVKLEAYGDVKLDEFHVAQTHLDDAMALLQAEAELRLDAAGAVDVQIEITDPAGKRRTIARRMPVKPGAQKLAVPIEITSPRRWWPVGYGRPDRYTVNLTLKREGRVLATAQRRIGLRTTELRREFDAHGRSFALVINGVPVFAKGANLVPFDSYPSRVTQADMDRVLVAAVQANMNIVRVWGGGYYPADAFYDTADALGLMVWQDFMFGGALPPDDSAFRENTRAEAIEQVRRLRHHPSVVLWAGNNEVQVSWDKWTDRLEFKKRIAPAEREAIVLNMSVLFGQVLRKAVAEHAPGTPYIASSPSADYDAAHDNLDDGDVHYWDVWVSKPLEDHLVTTPRFLSEFGLQSVPSLPTVAAFMAPRPIDGLPVQLSGSAYASGYDNGGGNARVLRLVRQYYGEPKTFADYVYVSQIMQAEGLEMAVQNMRASRPRGMGTLYWTLNDSWPGQINKLWAGTAWGSIDWHGRWKASHHRARRFYAPVSATALRREGVTTATLVSDRQTAFDSHWQLRVMDLDGRVIGERSGSTKAAPLAATALGKWTDAELLAGADPRRSVSVLDVMEGGRRVSRAVVYFALAKELALADPQLDAKLLPAASGAHTLRITAKSFARAVWAEFGALDVQLSDNAFYLAAGETVTLQVRSTASTEALQRALSVRSFYGAATP